MPKKGERIVAPRIMHILKQNNGVGMRFSEIFKVLAEHRWIHSQVPINENLKHLLAQGKIAKVNYRYGIIKTREDGTKFVVVKDPVNRTVELGK